jgi:hypothetical protein
MGSTLYSFSFLTPVELAPSVTCSNTKAIGLITKTMYTVETNLEFELQIVAKYETEVQFFKPMIINPVPISFPL